MSNGPFIFTITDLARFLGKSPVTIRRWESKGLVDLPRRGEGEQADRKLTARQVYDVARIAFAAERITRSRLELIGTVTGLLITIEKENQ